MKTFQYITGFNFYTIPDLCHCGCGNILYHRGQRYTTGHDSKHHVWNKGLTQSKEHRRKNSESHKGLPSGNKGKHPTDAVKTKNSQTHKGQVPWIKGKHHTLKSNKKNSEAHKGKIVSEKTKQQISQTLKKICLSGSKHPNWNGGTSFLPYCHKFNKSLKTAVKERDNNTCQLCCATNKKLVVHHVHYDKENCYPDLITLCRSDNCKVNFNRKHYEHLFMNKLNDRGLLFWTLSLYKNKTD